MIAGDSAAFGTLRLNVVEEVAMITLDRIYQRLAGRTRDFRESVIAFHEKRTPVHVGR